MNYKLLKFPMCLAMSILLGVSLTCCGDNDEPEKAKLSKTSYQMYHDEETAILGTEINDVVWKSENDFVARAANGTIKSYYVGETTVKGNKSNLSFKVTVKPKYNLGIFRK